MTGAITEPGSIPVVGSDCLRPRDRLRNFIRIDRPFMIAFLFVLEEYDDIIDKSVSIYSIINLITCINILHI